MNKKINLLALPLALSIQSGIVNAATPGLYAGAGGGFSSLDSDFYNLEQIDDGGFGGRVFLGYNFNRYLGLEANYSTFYKGTYAYVYNPNAVIEFKQKAVSLVGKAYMPFPNNSPFNLYLSLGVAQVYNDTQLKVYHYNAGLGKSDALVATGGIGASYDINERLVASFEVSGFGEKDSSYYKNAVSGSGLATFGLAYKFN